MNSSHIIYKIQYHDKEEMLLCPSFVKNQELILLALQLFGLNFGAWGYELADPQGFSQTTAKNNSERKKTLRSKPVYIEDLAKHDYFKDKDENVYQDEADKNINEEDTTAKGEDDPENFFPSYHAFFESSGEDEKEEEEKADALALEIITVTY